MKTAVLLLAGLVLAAPPAFGQQANPAPEDAGFVIRTESNLVVIPLHVYSKGSSVNGLTKDAFEIHEDGVRQSIAFVEGPADAGAPPGTARTVPTEIIFLIDFSHSVMMQNLLDFTTIRETLLEGLRRDVLISVYGFAGSLKRFTGPTRNFARLQRAIELTYESQAGGSRIYEAIMQTARDASQRGGSVSRMMIVFSDGFSTTKLDTDMVVSVANGYQIPIYPVILGREKLRERRQQRLNANRSAGNGNGNRVERRYDMQIGPMRNPNSARRGPSAGRDKDSQQAIFADIGRRTGGQSFDPIVLNNAVVRKILHSLADLAAAEYIVGYYPTAVDEVPTQHQVEVLLADKKIGKLYGGQRVITH